MMGHFEDKTIIDGEEDQLKYKKLLIIDDDTAVRDVVVDILEIENIVALGAENGEEGITLFKEHCKEIGAIVLDLSMPGLSSQDTFFTLRELCEKVPIILASGYSEIEVSQTYAQLTYTAYIQKPFHIDRLLEMVLPWLITPWECG